LPSGPPASRPRRFLRVLRFGFRLVAWPVLTAVLIFQIRLAVDGGLRLPGFVARELESRLAARGVVFHAEEIRLDPAGRLALRAVSLGLAGDGAPFATADALAIDLRRRALLHGIVDARRIDVTGLGLSLPARRSPSGADQPLLTGGEAAVEEGGDAGHLLAPAVSADLAVHRINAPDTGLPPAPLLLAASWLPFGDRLSADARTLLADSPWRFSLLGSPRALSGSAAADGAITPALLELIKPRLPPHAREILTLADPVRLVLAADLAEGGKLRRATARLDTGAAVAHEVSFTRASAHAVLEGTRLFVDDLMIVQGGNRADGTYEMDTATLAYRFLIGGRLRPMNIAGWFTDWWDHLWANFDFNGGAPAASADIAGIWGQPDLTTVFVSAETTGLKVRDLPLDRVATRVWIHAHSTDVIGFHAEQGAAVAEGSVARIIDPVEDEWQRMEFDVTSNLPPESIPQLFGDEGREITAPMRFSVPPALHIAGVVFGPAAGKDAGHQRYTLDLVTDAPFHFHQFPLDRLAVRIERTNDELALRDIRAGFADGDLTGEAIVSGPSDSRWLAFDANLAGAPSDTVLNRWHEFQLARAAGPAAPASGPAPAAPKPLGGLLDLALAATGPLDDPLAYSGRGTARITGADLARIRLFGLFSELLSGLGMGFSTLKLSDADARFSLNQNIVAFDRLYFSGSSSPVEAHGDYILPDGKLAFSARVLPFEKNGGILGNTAGLVLSPFASALEVELGGTLDKPTWTFAYGPLKLLRRITDQFAPSPTPPPAETKAPAAPPVEPPGESPRKIAPAS
jgi:AsmA-like C-terminal region